MTPTAIPAAGTLLPLSVELLANGVFVGSVRPRLAVADVEDEVLALVEVDVALVLESVAVVVIDVEDVVLVLEVELLVELAVEEGGDGAAVAGGANVWTDLLETEFDVGPETEPKVG